MSDKNSESPGDQSLSFFEEKILPFIFFITFLNIGLKIGKVLSHAGFFAKSNDPWVIIMVFFGAFIGAGVLVVTMPLIDRDSKALRLSINAVIVLAFFFFVIF